MADTVELTQERLKALVSYDPETGIFRRLRDGGGKRAGDIAGCRKRTYTMVSVDGRLYRAHLLAFLYMTGTRPLLFVDHRDTDKHNNAWGNLREATKSQNQANVGLSKSNASGLKGVSRYRPGEAYGKPWQASICKDGKTRHLGHFAEKAEAHEAYIRAAEVLFGEFARAA